MFFCCNLALAEDAANGDGSYSTTPYDSVPDDGEFIYDNNCPPGQTNAAVIPNNNGGTVIGFGGCHDTFAISYTINELLQAEGISVDKIHYRWKYLNGCFNTSGVASATGETVSDQWCTENIEDRVDLDTGEILDTVYADQFDILTVTVEITDINGNIIETRTYDIDTWYDWQNSNSHSDNEVYEDGAYWQIDEDFIQLYDHTNGTGSIYTPDSLGNAVFRVQSKDGGMWDGRYGPIIRDGQIWFTYRSNPCAQTALYDPSCEGYSEAYAEQQYNDNCSANALYDPGCPGYDNAYYEQQCSNDPLYDSGCYGYSEAYYNQQCNADPLYDSGCPGYQEARYNQQCEQNVFYDSGCPGYDEAYYEYQCNADPLYDSGCGGYADAYAQYEYEQQCSANALYDSGCPGYDEAYFTYQCEQDTLYDSSCPGYDEAYFTYQCNANSLYDIRCDGYQEAYFNQQCTQNPQYDTQCIGYVEPVVETPTPDNNLSTGDVIVDTVLSAPVVVIAEPEPMPEPIAAEIPEPQPIEVVVVVSEAEEPTSIEEIEAEIEAEIEQESNDTNEGNEIPEETTESEEEATDSVDETETEESNEDTTENNSDESGGSEEEVEETISPVVSKKPVLTAKQKQKAKEAQVVCTFVIKGITSTDFSTNKLCSGLFDIRKITNTRS